MCSVFKPVEPTWVWIGEVAARTAIGQHRPFAGNVEQRNDGARATGTAHDDVGPVAASASVSARPVASSPTWPMNRAEPPAMHAAATTLAALPPRRCTIRAAVSLATFTDSRNCTTTSCTRSPITPNIALLLHA